MTHTEHLKLWEKSWINFTETNLSQEQQCYGKYITLRKSLNPSKRVSPSPLQLANSWKDFTWNESSSLTCGTGPVWKGHGCANGPWAAWVVEMTASWRSEAAGVEMMVRVIEGMDGMGTNHSCEWTQDREMLNMLAQTHTNHSSRAKSSLFPPIQCNHSLGFLVAAGWIWTINHGFYICLKKINTLLYICWSACLSVYTQKKTSEEYIVKC